LTNREFFCVCVYGSSHKHGKKERGLHPAILIEQAQPIKDLLYGKKTLFSCGTQGGIPSGQDSAIFPAQVANHSAGFGSCNNTVEQGKNTD